MKVVKKSVALHPIMDSYIRKTWAILIDSGYNAGYSTALNFMLLMAIHEAIKPAGLSDKTKENIWNFMEDVSTIDKLNLEDHLTALSDKLK